MTGGRSPPRGSLDGDGIRVVDRHDQPIGTKANEGPPSGDGPLEIALTDTLRHLLGLEEGTITIPAGWIAGVRRDEIRLDMAVHDPAFPSAVFDEREDGPPSPADDTDLELPRAAELGSEEREPTLLHDPDPLAAPLDGAADEPRIVDPGAERGPEDADDPLDPWVRGFSGCLRGREVVDRGSASDIAPRDDDRDPRDASG